MKTIGVQIKGITPYLMHAFNGASIGVTTRKLKTETTSAYTEAHVEAEKAVSLDEDGDFCFPSRAIVSTIANAGKNHKQVNKPGRSTLRNVVPYAVRIDDLTIKLLDVTAKPFDKYDIDARRVVIGATGGAIIRYRPMFKEWFATFTINLDDEAITKAKCHELLGEAGNNVGIGDFRPECTGPFGRFEVVEFNSID